MFNRRNNAQYNRCWVLAVAMLAAGATFFGIGAAHAQAQDHEYEHRRSALSISCPAGYEMHGPVFTATCSRTVPAIATVDADGMTHYSCSPLAVSEGTGAAMTCTETMPLGFDFYPSNPAAPVVPPGYESVAWTISHAGNTTYFCPEGSISAGAGSTKTCTLEGGNETVPLQVIQGPAFMSCPFGTLQGSGYLARCLAPEGTGDTSQPEPLRCGAMVVTINLNIPGVPFIGTNGDDVILGTPNDDVIEGRGGDDVICGGAGRDRIRGGSGSDVIIGGSERDRIWGEAGSDIVYGNGGSDFIDGGLDGDRVYAGSGADRVFGGPGADYLQGMGGQDFLWGDDGNDTLLGNWQSDHLHGGPGNDTLRGAGGKDKLHGDDGDDLLFGGNNTDYLDGGAGNDTADGQRGIDNPLVPDVSGCIAETRISC